MNYKIKSGSFSNGIQAKFKNERMSKNVTRSRENVSHVTQHSYILKHNLNPLNSILDKSNNERMRRKSE